MRVHGAITRTTVLLLLSTVAVRAQSLPLPAAVPTGEVTEIQLAKPEEAEASKQRLARFIARIKVLKDDSKQNWFPLKSQKEAEHFWGSAAGTQYLPHLKLFASEDRRVVATDLVVSYIGPTRHAFGFSLSSADRAEGQSEAKAQELKNLEKMFAAGGDAYVTVAYPFLCFPKCPHVTVDGTRATEPIATLTALAAPRAGFLLPALGTATDEFEGNLDTAVEVIATLGRSSADLQYVVQLRQGFVATNDDFATLLGLTETVGQGPQASTRPNNAFAFGQWTFGVRIKSLFVVSLQGLMFAPSQFKERTSVRLVTQIIPSAK